MAVVNIIETGQFYDRRTQILIMKEHLEMLYIELWKNSDSVGKYLQGLRYKRFVTKMVITKSKFIT